MRWPWCKPKPAPLLSDAEMARLHEEIFEEPVTVEFLFAMYDRRPRDVQCEWVMDQHTMNRIRMALTPHWLPFSGASLNMSNYETRRKAADIQDQLIGLPIVVEPFAKLAIRPRAGA